ncbi:MAG: glycosyltransferase family 4 protein [Oscillospiraceae bacterium]
MAILEAFSYGLPVVSTDVGGIGEVVRFGVDAEKTDGSPQSIANAVLKIRASLADYSGAAYEAAGEYDYRKANQPVFETLNRFLNWKTAPRQGDSER